MHNLKKKKAQNYFPFFLFSRESSFNLLEEKFWRANKKNQYLNKLCKSDTTPFELSHVKVKLMNPVMKV